MSLAGSTVPVSSGMRTSATDCGGCGTLVHTVSSDPETHPVYGAAPRPAHPVRTHGTVRYPKRSSMTPGQRRLGYVLICWFSYVLYGRRP